MCHLKLHFASSKLYFFKFLLKTYWDTKKTDQMMFSDKNIMIIMYKLNFIKNFRKLFHDFLTNYYRKYIKTIKINIK